MNSLNISVTILTKNSEKYLKEVLAPLQVFDEVLLYDNGSEDQTVEIAKNFPNVKILHEKFEGFGPTHNKASQAAKHDWILSIDSDEVVTTSMIQEIVQLKLEKSAVYSFPRHNYFNGKLIKWCGWYPDRQIRLYHRRSTGFSEAQVHESIISQGMTHIELAAPLIHYSYSSIADFLTKMQSYSHLFAKQYRGRKSSSPCKAIVHGLYAFFKSYLIKRGFLGGYEGFIISAYNGHTAYYKYLKLYEANQSKKLD